MVSLLPEDSLVRLRAVLGEKLGGLNARGVQTLVMADLEGEVSNSRLQLMRMEHPFELTKMLQGLASRGFLDQVGQKRGTSYRLPAGASALTDGASALTDGASALTDGASALTDGASALTDGAIVESDGWLLEIAKTARDKPRLMPELTKTIIRNLCSGGYLTAEQIGELMNRGKDKLQKKFLAVMVADGELALRFPEQPTHPDQAYRTNPDWGES